MSACIECGGYGYVLVTEADGEVNHDVCTSCPDPAVPPRQTTPGTPATAAGRALLGRYHRAAPTSAEGRAERALMLDAILAIEAEASAPISVEALALRRALWLEHMKATQYDSGHLAYGDDGEMQCHGMDYRRDPVDALSASEAG